ncbi:hypothetical protein [Streptomyces goshikiensis]|uniref:hypothetical protein n=1 Tax=Streptomyces goshikiensis TaxID=1942 RepID=UPI002ADFE814|nr:hypothetical protein [Streptomyces goshikiensis]
MNAYTAAALATTFKHGDFVLYRDPEKFWKGEADHTFVCRIDDIAHYSSGESAYTLTRLSGGLVAKARREYMRLLPPADAMHDIDTAPLNTAVADDMTPAAVAWLTQQAATISRRPELPPYSG